MSSINPTFTDRYRDAVVDLISGSITANSLNLSGNLFVAGDTEIQGNAIIDDIVSLSGKVRWDNGTSDGLSGANSVSIGNLAGKTTQGSTTVAVGYAAATTNQQQYGVAIGAAAGNNTQGSQAVAIGVNSGNSGQGNYCVAIGGDAGKTTQGVNSVAVGNKSGEITQGTYAVAVGNSAGRTSQGSSSIAIGKQAGETNQHNNSIVLNASGSALNTDGTSRFFVNPIRGVDLQLGIGTLYYDTTNKEIQYSTTSGSNNFITGTVTLPTSGGTAHIEVPWDTTKNNLRITLYDVCLAGVNALPYLNLGSSSGYWTDTNSVYYNGIVYVYNSGTNSSASANLNTTGNIKLNNVNISNTSRINAIFEFSRIGLQSNVDTITYSGQGSLWITDTNMNQMNWSGRVKGFYVYELCSKVRIVSPNGFDWTSGYLRYVAY